MSNALHEIYSDELYKSIITQLKNRKDIDGGNNYMSTLAEFVRNKPAMIELVSLVLDWQSKDAQQLQKIKYVLIEGAASALTQKKFEFTQNAYAKAEKI